jgi:tetratricopeptide (TPR) repeat protein
MELKKYLLFLLLPCVFIAGCIRGQAVVSLNSDGSGKISVEGLFDYPLYHELSEDYDANEIFYLNQIKAMISSGGFDAWSDVDWKFLDDGRCYFKGTAYFSDINRVDFFIGAAKTGVKLQTGRRRDEKPTVELKLQNNFQLDRQFKDLPSDIFQTFSLSLVAAMPAEIEGCENFQRINKNTAMFVFTGGQWLSYLRNNTVKLALACDGNDLFDYKTEVIEAKKNYALILKRIEAALNKQYPVPAALLEIRFKQGLASQEQGNFEKALKLYGYVLQNSGANKKLAADTAYQTGVCLIKIGRIEQASAQFESVINKYPQTSAALKAVKAIQDMKSPMTYREPDTNEEIIFVIDTFPKLYAENIDPNTSAVKMKFSKPMNKTLQFYSSFAPAEFPLIAGKPVFDTDGVEWILPVRLQAGKVYALAINYGDAVKNTKNLQLGFQSRAGKMCEKFVLVFATAQTDPNAEPIAIDDEFIDRCEEIN